MNFKTFLNPLKFSKKFSTQNVNGHFRYLFGANGALMI